MNPEWHSFCCGALVATTACVLLSRALWWRAALIIQRKQDVIDAQAAEIARYRWQARNQDRVFGGRMEESERN